MDRNLLPSSIHPITAPVRNDRKKSTAAAAPLPEVRLSQCPAGHEHSRGPVASLTADLDAVRPVSFPEVSDCEFVAVEVTHHVEEDILRCKRSNQLSHKRSPTHLAPTYLNLASPAR